MKKISILFSLLFVCYFTKAQHMEFEKVPSYGFEVRVGAVVADFDEINAVLAQSGFETFDQEVGSFEFLFTKRFNKFPIGTHFGFNYLRALDENGEKFNTDNQAFTARTLGSGGVNLGFDVYAVDKKWFGLSPYVDFDFNRTVLKLHEGIPPNFSLGNAANSDLKTSKFTNGDLMSEIGLNLELRFPIRGIRHSLGIAGGYRLDLLNNDWRYEDELGVDFPDFQWTGWQFAIKFGVELKGCGHQGRMDKQPAEGSNN